MNSFKIKKRYIRAKYGLESTINANFIEDKENMFLSVEFMIQI